MSEVEHWRRARLVRLYEVSQHTLWYRIDEILTLFTTVDGTFPKSQIIELRDQLEKDRKWLLDHQIDVNNWIVRSEPVSFPDFAPTYSEAAVQFAGELLTWARVLTDPVDGDDTEELRYSWFQSNQAPCEPWWENQRRFMQQLRASCQLELRMAKRLAESRAQQATDEVQSRSPGPPDDSSADEISIPPELDDALTPQGRQIFTFLLPRQQWTRWDSLPNGCWQNGKDTSEQNDRTVQAGLERVRNVLNNFPTLGLILSIRGQTITEGTVRIEQHK